MKIARLLVVNRGEIAIRIARAARDYGISVVGLHTQTEDSSLMVRYFDEIITLPGVGVSAYLDQAAVASLALSHDVDSIHPGYGFLSENADFAQLVIDRGMSWIGPPPSAIRTLGNKVVARQLANELEWLSNPVVELGDNGLETTQHFIDNHGLPIVFKAVDGGGGRGMRVVHSLPDLAESYEAAKAEARRSFGSDRLLIERYIDGARHIELQVLADAHGGKAFVGTRDCSMQRRFQKLLEEAPAPGLTHATTQQMCAVADHLCEKASYQSAGTFEYLVGPQGDLAFLEVNTRLQVEHTVTEETAGLDMVTEQFRIAEGGHVPTIDPISSRGHAIELRINADDVHNAFLPSTGRIERLRLPSGPGVRIDAGVEEGSVIGPQFDSLLLKLVIYGSNRHEAIARAKRALRELTLEGVTTNQGLFDIVLNSELFRSDNDQHIDTGWLEREVLPSLSKEEHTHHEPFIVIGQQHFQVSLLLDADKLTVLPIDDEVVPASSFEGEITIVAPMQAMVTRIMVLPGEQVTIGTLLFALEAMKMENSIRSPVAGSV
jgi:acetyl-CoA/propionyl-CoA carboxylase biotin carboxyl carrier protein